MNKETFCSLPFNEIFLGPDGGIKPCCSSWENIGNLHDNKIDDILNSDIARRMRKSIIDGVWDPACETCRRQEAQGARSERKSNVEEFLEQNNLIDESYFKLTRLDLRWSNTCNLSCTYCYEYFSSKWSQIKGIKVNTIKDENENSLFLLIEKHKPTINVILMLGGEPFLQKQNARLIETLTGRSFYVLTNLAVPLKTNKIAQQYIKEPMGQIGVSFETVRDRYEYVRHGASWEVFEENVKYINTVRESHFRLEAHSLYSIYSAFNMVEFYDFILENNFKDVFWNLLESSGNNDSASVLNLSADLREKAILELDSCLRQFKDAPGRSWLETYRENLISSLSNADHQNGKFLEEIRKLEEEQLLDMKKRFKELWPDVYGELIK